MPRSFPQSSTVLMSADDTSGSSITLGKSGYSFIYDELEADMPTFLSDDIYPKCPGILAGLKPYETLTAHNFRQSIAQPYLPLHCCRP